ncbi:MAG: iron-containing alcohol dehydrogenase [Candidatus Aminicenantes bacterium]|jgi:alcohol dehydrogenase
MQFRNPTRVVFDSGSLSQLGQIVHDEIRAHTPFLVTDKGIEEAGIPERVIDQIPGIHKFNAIEQNPKHPTIDRGGEIVRQSRADLIIGLGGGSVLDAAKAIALLATNPGNIEDYEGRGKYKTPPLPVVAIPTTCGTASEVTWVSVITHTGRKFKMSIKGPHMFPAVALVDPDLLKTLPSDLVASTGMDALTHAIEAYTVKPATFMTDIFARESLFYIFASIEAAYRDIKTSIKAREGIMKGSMLAGFAFGNSDVGGVHCLAESIGALYDIAHGVANAVLLPYVMEYNLPVSTKKYAGIARIAGIDVENDKEAAHALIQKVKELASTLNIPSFKDLGIMESDFPEIAQKSFANNSNPSNPRDIATQDYVDILTRAYSDT